MPARHDRLPHALLLVAVAAALAAVDLVTKWEAIRVVPTAVAYHSRSFAYVWSALLAAGALAGLVPLVGSTALDLAAGAICGGAVGNATSALAWSPGVPDFVRLGGIVFNLADVLVWAGLAMLLLAAATLALQPARRRV
jgi:hypothetical protein